MVCRLVTAIAHLGACVVKEWGDGEMVINGGRPKKGGENIPPNELTSSHPGSEFEHLQ
jgi:hypothetical protein